jgi:RNA polymerase sigma-54 factor
MLKPTLQLRLSQQLTMTPQLQQAIRLLQLPIMELQTQIQDALEQNVMLEAEESDGGESGESQSEELPEVEVADETDWEDTPTAGIADSPRNNEPGLMYEQADRSDETLREHLLWQLEMENLGSVKSAIGQAIVDAINDDGYLTDDLETIRATLAPDVLVSVDEIEAVLALIQKFDPVGVAAQSVSECILLQLDQLGAKTPGLDLARDITWSSSHSTSIRRCDGCSGRRKTRSTRL